MNGTHTLPDDVVLPPLIQQRSLNCSSRNGTTVNLLVWHETAGSYDGAVSWLCNPAAQASAHIVVREDGLQATQLVPLAEKAWHSCAFNPRSIGVEHANTTAKGYATEQQLEVSARIFGWLCLKYSIPPRWSRDGSIAGVTRHRDLGVLGCNHPLCGPVDEAWARFLVILGEEIKRGGYRHEWAI